MRASVFRPHLEQGELDVSLDVGVRVFEIVAHFLVAAGAETVANAALDLVLQRAPGVRSVCV